MPAPKIPPRPPAKLDERLAHRQRADRRIALWVAALLIAALLGPFVAQYVAG